MVNGRSLWKNGYRKLPNYVPEMLEALGEGSSVGVVKRGQSLHFLVNGADLGVAEEALPPGTKVGVSKSLLRSLKFLSWQILKIVLISGSPAPRPSQQFSVAPRKEKLGGPGMRLNIWVHILHDFITWFSLAVLHHLGVPIFSLMWLFINFDLSTTTTLA